jgi:hypothetical protein
LEVLNPLSIEYGNRDEGGDRNYQSRGRGGRGGRGGGRGRGGDRGEKKQYDNPPRQQNRESNFFKFYKNDITFHHFVMDKENPPYMFKLVIFLIEGSGHPDLESETRKILAKYNS